jgi:hypothetical protein
MSFEEWWREEGGKQDCSYSVIAALAWNAADRAAKSIMENS